MKIRFPKFDFVGMPLLGLVVTAFFILESKYHLRKRTRPKAERLLRNGSVAAVVLPTLRLLLGFRNLPGNSLLAALF